MMITAEEVAEMLGISRGAVYDLAAPKGPIPCVRFGRRCIRFKREDIQALEAVQWIGNLKLYRRPSKCWTASSGWVLK